MKLQGILGLLFFIFALVTYGPRTAQAQSEPKPCWQLMTRIEGIAHVEDVNTPSERKSRLTRPENGGYLSYWDIATGKERPQAPLTHVIFRPGKSPNFSNQFSMEEKIALLSQLAARGVKVGFVNPATATGDIGTEISGLYINSEPFIEMGASAIKISSIQEISISGTSQILSLTRTYRLPIHNASPEEEVSLLSEGNVQAPAILMDLQSVGGELTLLSYHLDRLNLRGSQLVKISESYGGDKEKLLSDILSENPNLRLSGPPMTRTFPASRIEANYTFVPIMPLEPLDLGGVDIDKVKTLFFDIMTNKVKVAIEYLDNAQLKGQIRIASGVILNLKITALGPSVVLDGQTSPIPLNQIRYLVSKNETAFTVNFNAAGLTSANNALSEGSPKLEKSKVIEFSPLPSIQRVNGEMAKILEFGKPVPRPKPAAIIPPTPKDETPAAPKKPSVLSQMIAAPPPPQEKGRRLVMPKSTSPEVKKDELGKIIIFPGVPRPAVGGSAP